MSGKYALIIANTQYIDQGLAQLTAPGKDSEDFARVLKDQDICAFDEVKILLNQISSTVIEAVDEFFDQKKPDDLLVLYFSGHGVRDELGSLYLAVRNTIRTRLRSTAVRSDYIREAMDQSRSKRQVLILDCCNSGAFAQGTKAATGVSIGTASEFEAGYGRIILTASDSTQFAWEGDKVIGETDNSLFTHFLVEGLDGEADLDGDGQITVDELYDYAYEKVKAATPKQTPSKFSSKQQGEIVLRQSIKLEDIKSVPLPAPILDSLENPFADIRLGTVQQLTKLLHGKNRGLARSAREALEGIAENDDSRQVSRAATQALELARQGSPTIQLEAEAPQSPVVQKQEHSKLETVGATHSSRQQALITLGWAMAGVVGGIAYDGSEEEIGGAVGGAIGGAIGGLITAIALRNENPRLNRNSIFWMAVAWAIGIAVGWQIGDTLTEAINIAIGYTIGATISMGIMLGFGYVTFNRKSMTWIVLAWAIGGAIGWLIAKKLLIDNRGIDYVTSWAIGTAIGWTIGGYVLGWQLLKATKEASQEQFEGKGVIAEFIEKHKIFLLSWKGRILIGVTVGLILGILYGVLYGIIHDISYDFAYAYLSFDNDVPHIFLLVVCGLAGLIAYPHRWTIPLMIGGFIIFFIANSQGYLLYDLLAFGGVFGLPTGALVSRILFWLKILK